MVFSSPIFLFWFLPLVLFCYYLVDRKYRNGVLLFFSLLFYGWGEGEMLTLMLVSTLLNYVFGIQIQNATVASRSKWILFLGVSANLSLLLYYKYANFFVDNYNFAASHLGIETVTWEKVILPLGISFYTFHGISYIIDVYRKHTSAQRDPFKLALYISFFPQLIAGPIIRYKDVQDQIDDRRIDIPLFASGIKRFVIGLAKKILIANIVGRIPEMVFKMPESELNAYWSWLGVIAVAVQLYFDFSGYSDMAIGLARMFGFRFLENFNYPYISQSMKEFWTRWHISLSNWFRDYVYYPLGGNKKGKFRMHLNLWTIFLLNGIWHGANWSFVIFGIYHGSLLTFERIGFDRVLNFIPRVFRSIYVFIVFALGDVLFSIEDIHHAYAYYCSLFDFSAPDPFHRIHLYLTSEWYFTLILGLILSIPSAEFLFSQIQNIKRKQLLETCIILLLFVLSVSELANTSYNPFIYFRF
ncbi:MAG: MBOAT family protein [Bacteroidetes bacterium]|nr:MBOAT family protein [Bacteroidota bacterium]